MHPTDYHTHLNAVERVMPYLQPAQTREVTHIAEARDAMHALRTDLPDTVLFAVVSSGMVRMRAALHDLLNEVTHRPIGTFTGRVWLHERIMEIIEDTIIPPRPRRLHCWWGHDHFTTRCDSCAFVHGHRLGRTP